MKMKPLGGTSRVWVAVVGVSLGCATSPAEGQQQPSVDLTLGFSAGTFIQYPSVFSPRSCERDAWGISGSAGRRVWRSLWVELSTVVARPSGEQRCFFPLAPAPIDGSTIRRAVYDDAVPGPSLVASHLALGAEPRLAGPLHARLRIGAGRLWDKRLWNRYWSLGLEWRDGPGTLFVDVQRWRFGVDFESQLLTYRDSGAHELIRSESVHESFEPYLLTVGWEFNLR